jgi:hypothetical protein
MRVKRVHSANENARRGYPPWSPWVGVASEEAKDLDRPCDLHPIHLVLLYPFITLILMYSIFFPKTINRLTSFLLNRLSIVDYQLYCTPFCKTGKEKVSGNNKAPQASSRWPHILPLSAPAKRFRFEGHIKTLSHRIMTTYRLLIAIEHVLPKWPLVDFRKKSPSHLTMSV